MQGYLSDPTVLHGRIPYLPRVYLLVKITFLYSALFVYSIGYTKSYLDIRTCLILGAPLCRVTG